MAYTHFTGTVPAAKTAQGAGWLTTLRSTFTRWVLYRRTINELSRLSQRELADLGLSASMIDNVAHQAAYGN